jgi:hypothetical protein
MSVHRLPALINLSSGRLIVGNIPAVACILQHKHVHVRKYISVGHVLLAAGATVSASGSRSHIFKI